MSPEKQPNINIPKQQPIEKKRVIIADVDIEQQARDIAEEKLLSSKAESKGLRGFWNRIWKQNLAHEYYRQKEIAKAKREIQQSGNLYVGEKGEKADHENAMNAIAQRFVTEYGDELLREGEKKKSLGNEKPEEKSLKKDVQDLIKNFAEGKLSEDQFNIEKNKLFNTKLSDIKDSNGEKFGKENSLYADNLLEIAKQIKEQVKGSIAHGKGLDALDTDFEIVIGKAKAGVETEAQYNAVDKIIEKIKKNSVGKFASRFVNEATIASAVSIAYGIGVKGAISATQRAARWVGPVGLGLSAGIGGAVAGFRENKRIKEERAQHDREMAKGGKQIENGSEKREEMEKFRYETKNAKDLTDNLQKSLEELKNQPNENKLHEVLDHLNEISARITFSEQKKIDLVSFSDSKNVEKERTEMYISAAKAKVFLKKNIGASWSTFYNNEKELDEYLQHNKDVKIENDFLKDKTQKDEMFNKMKRGKVAWAVTKGMGIGLGVGIVAQEALAYVGVHGSQEGLLSSGSAHATDQVHHYTALEALRRYISDDMPRVDASHMHEVAISHSANIKIPEGMDLTKNTDGSFNIVQNGTHEAIVGNIKFNPDGTLADESKKFLQEKGIFSQDVLQHISEGKTSGANEFINGHKNLFSEIKHGSWADNDTLKPDKNELKLWWGGEKGTGVDASGNYVFNIKHMTHMGSFHHGQHWDPQALMKEGKIKMLISLSKDTQNQVVEIPIDANGNAIIDPNSEIGKIAFENVNGHAKFLGKFAEVAVMDDATHKANVLATHVGKGVGDIISTKDVHTTILDMQADYDFDMPYIIPIVPHKSLEKLGEKDKAKIEKGIEKIEKNITRIDIDIANETDPVKKEKLEKERLIEQTRAAAMHTLYKLKNYSDINADKKEEGDEKFIKLTRELWDELAIHERPDRDANACLKLMELAGIKLGVSNVRYVEQGKFSESGITMDSSMNDGVVVEEGGKRLIFDHHGKNSGRDTSAAKFVYEVLVEMGLLKKEKYLDNFIEFVTKCDNMSFAPDEMKQVHQNYPKSLYGLSYRMKTEDILELFKKGVDPKKDLPEDYLRSHEYPNPQKGGANESLENLSKHIERQMANGKKSLEWVEKNGFILDSGKGRFGKILIDTKKSSAKEKYYCKVDGENNSNQMEVFLKGYGGYLVWSPEEKSFVLYTQRKMDDKSLPGGFSQGFNMRGNMWMKSMNDPVELSVTLEEIFSKLSGKNSKIEGSLKKTLDKDMAGKDVLKLIDENKLTEAEMKRIVKDRGISFKDLLYSILSNNRSNISTIHREKMKTLSGADKNDEKKMEKFILEILLKYQDSIKNGAKQQGGKASTTIIQPQQPPTPENQPVKLDQKQEAISSSVKKLNDSFSKFELSHDAIKKEAGAINVSPAILAKQFIQENDELRPLYEARSGSINGQDDNAIEKLAVIVILENEEKKVKEQIKEKDKEMTAAKNDQEKQKIESEKDDLIDKLGDIGEQLIPLEIF